MGFFLIALHCKQVTNLNQDLGLNTKTDGAKLFNDEKKEPLVLNMNWVSLSIIYKINRLFLIIVLSCL